MSEVLKGGRSSVEYHRGHTVGIAVPLALLVIQSLAYPTHGEAQDPFATRGETFTFSGVSFPSVIDTFAVMVAQRYPDPNLGTQLQYRSPIAPRMPFDISVYRADLRQGEGETVRREFEQALEGVQAYPRNDVEVTVEATDSLAIITDDGVVYLGWRAEFRLDRGSASQTSLLFVFVKDGWFLKYRLSFERALRTFLAPRVETFLRESLGAVRVEGG